MKTARLAWDSGAFGNIRGFNDSFFSGEAFFSSPRGVDGLSFVFASFGIGFAPALGGGETGLERLVGACTFVASGAAAASMEDDSGELFDSLLRNLSASRSSLIFSARLSGLSARVSYVTRRRFATGSVSLSEDACG